MVALVTLSRVRTPWYCAYVRLTIGVAAAEIEGAKQEKKEKTGKRLSVHIFQSCAG